MSASMARLEVVAGRATGMSILVDDELLIGRHAEGAGRLAEDEEISRSHARLSLDRAGYCAIEDLGSTNGTYVNGLRIGGPQTISEGDTIEIGATTLVVRELPAPRSAGSLTTRPPHRTGAPLGAEPGGPQLTPTTIGGRAYMAPEGTPPEGPPREEPGPEPPDPPGPDVPGPGAPEVPGPQGLEAPGPSALSLQLDVDFVAREARITFADGAGPLRLVFRDGSWRPIS